MVLYSWVAWEWEGTPHRMFLLIPWSGCTGSFFCSTASYTAVWAMQLLALREPLNQGFEHLCNGPLCKQHGNVLLAFVVLSVKSCHRFFHSNLQPWAWQVDQVWPCLSSWPHDNWEYFHQHVRELSTKGICFTCSFLVLSTQTGQWCRVCHEQYLLSFALRYTVGQSCSITSLSVGGWRSDNLRLVSELSRLFYWICRKSQVGNNVLNHSRFYHILAVLWENDEWCLQIARTSSRHWCNLPLVVTWKVWWASKECWFGDSTDVTWGVSSKTHHCSTWAALSQLCLHDVIWRGMAPHPKLQHLQPCHDATDVCPTGCWSTRPVMFDSPPGLDTLLFSLVATWKKSVDLSPSSSVGWNSKDRLKGWKNERIKE